jgi:hypothetical protein
MKNTSHRPMQPTRGRVERTQRMVRWWMAPSQDAALAGPQRNLSSAHFGPRGSGVCGDPTYSSQSMRASDCGSRRGLLVRPASGENAMSESLQP